MSIETKALGCWPNAPLAMVLAQVRFEPSPDTTPTSVVERMALAVGDLMPIRSAAQEITFLIDAGGAPLPRQTAEKGAGFELRNKANSRVLRLNEGVLTYSTSAYEDSGHFLAEWRRMLEALCGAGDIHVTRLGLRYIDFIIPSANRTPEEYFVDGFAPQPRGIELAPVAFFVLKFPREHGGELRVQYGRGFGPPALPPDLTGAVAPPFYLTKRYAEGLSAVLDMDRWRPTFEAMAAGRIAEEFQALRDDLAGTFRRIISSFAEAEWRNATEEMA